MHQYENSRFTEIVMQRGTKLAPKVTSSHLFSNPLNENSTLAESAFKCKQCSFKVDKWGGFVVCLIFRSLWPWRRCREEVDICVWHSHKPVYSPSCDVAFIYLSRGYDRIAAQSCSSCECLFVCCWCMSVGACVSGICVKEIVTAHRRQSFGVAWSLSSFLLLFHWCIIATLPRVIANSYECESVSEGKKGGRKIKTNG